MFDCTKDLPFTEWYDRLQYLTRIHALVKIGTVTLFPEEAEEAYTQGKYLVTATKIYQIYYSNAQQRYYGQRIYATNKGQRLTRPGRYYVYTAEQVNHLIGVKLVK